MRVFDSIEDVQVFLHERGNAARSQAFRLQDIEGPGILNRREQIAFEQGLRSAYIDAAKALSEVRPGTVAAFERLRQREREEVVDE